MELVALVEPSDGINPGHMAIGQEAGIDLPRFFGYHFDPSELPQEFQAPERWQEYLFNNRTFGEIRDDTRFVNQLREMGVAKYLESVLHVSYLCHAAYYSFSPDDFHSDAQPCYDCVAWAIMMGNIVVPGFLKPVRQGRIKLIIEQLRGETPHRRD